jgi:hypothetical protein
MAREKTLTGRSIFGDNFSVKKSTSDSIDVFVHWVIVMPGKYLLR